MSEIEKRLDEQISTCANLALGALGPGFSRREYRDALAYELRGLGLMIDRDYPVGTVHVGVDADGDDVWDEVYVDLRVERRVGVCVLAKPEIDPKELMQMAVTVAVSGLGLGLVLNFGQEELEVRRIWPDDE